MDLGRITIFGKIYYGMADLLREKIIEAIRAGDENVFEMFFKLEYNKVVFFVNQFLKDYSLSKDVAQESFISLWNSRETLNPNLNVRAYLFIIARNKSLNLLRNKLYAVSDPQEKRLINLHILTLESDHIESKIDSLELERLIERTYSLLPEQIRKTFIMSRKEGLSYEEIALKRGITVKSVEYQISVALKVFRRKLKGYLSIF